MRADAAWIREVTRDWAAALRTYDEALNIWPDDINLVAGKAGVYQKLGELDRAQALLERLRPKAEDNWAISVICDQAILRRQHAKAIALLRASIEQPGSLPSRILSDFRFELGDLQRLSGELLPRT
jgi:tetratricopeptide (TPR) repeat protein